MTVTRKHKSHSLLIFSIITWQTQCFLPPPPWRHQCDSFLWKPSLGTGLHWLHECYLPNLDISFAAFPHIQISCLLQSSPSSVDLMHQLATQGEAVRLTNWCSQCFQWQKDPEAQGTSLTRKNCLILQCHQVLLWQICNPRLNFSFTVTTYTASNGHLAFGFPRTDRPTHTLSVSFKITLSCSNISVNRFVLRLFNNLRKNRPGRVLSK